METRDDGTLDLTPPTPRLNMPLALGCVASGVGVLVAVVYLEAAWGWAGVWPGILTDLGVALFLVAVLAVLERRLLRERCGPHERNLHARQPACLDPLANGVRRRSHLRLRPRAPAHVAAGLGRALPRLTLRARSRTGNRSGFTLRLHLRSRRAPHLERGGPE